MNADRQASKGDIVVLVCVREAAKLRVKIASQGYPSANCQFPRHLRKEGSRYTVPAEAVKLINSGRRKAYYTVCTHDVSTLDDESSVVSPQSVYFVTDDGQCLSCCDAPCNTVCAPCGHFFLCHNCAPRLSTCAICRQEVKDKVNIADIV